jgi:hypothetical protein
MLVKAGYKGSDMTVCAAAMCEQAGIVIGAADRMITSGDIEFEPPQTKSRATDEDSVAVLRHSRYGCWRRSISN